MDGGQTAEALYEAARVANDKGDFAELKRLGEHLYGLSEPAHDSLGMARARNFLGIVALAAGDGDTAEHLYRDSLQYYTKAGDRRGEAIALLNLGCVAADMRLDLLEARRLWEESLVIFREYQDTLRIAIATANLGEINRLEGDFAKAYEYGTESLALFRILGDDMRSAWQLVNIAHYRLLRREYRESIAALREAFEMLSGEKNPEHLANYFDTWFLLAVDMARYDVASTVWGFVERYRAENGMPRLPSMMPWFAPRVEKLQKRARSTDFENWRDRGASMSMEELDRLTAEVRPPA